jgi:hypothetical protein
LSSAAGREAHGGRWSDSLADLYLCFFIQQLLQLLLIKIDILSGSARIGFDVYDDLVETSKIRPEHKIFRTFLGNVMLR